MSGQRWTTALMGVMAGWSLQGPVAQAQWTATSYGVAEYDTKETLLLLAGVTASPKGLGWSPSVGVQAYHLSYDGGGSRTSVVTVRPAIGLGNHFEGGTLYGTVGYAFSNKDVGPGIVAADQGDGTVVSGGYQVWGTGGPMGYQVLGSYNFGSESFWGRGRVTRRIGAANPSFMQWGGEVAYLTGKGYNAWQPGGVLEWHTASGKIVGLGAGAKVIGNGGGNAAYVKLEGVLPLIR